MTLHLAVVPPSLRQPLSSRLFFLSHNQHAAAVRQRFVSSKTSHLYTRLFPSVQSARASLPFFSGTKRWVGSRPAHDPSGTSPSPPPWLRPRGASEELKAASPVSPPNFLVRTGRLLFTTVGYGFLLYTAHLTTPFFFSALGLPQVMASTWTPILVVVGSFLLPGSGALALRLVPAFMLSAALFEVTVALLGAFIRADYSMHTKRSESWWNKLFGSYSLEYDEQLGVYDYKRRALHALLGLKQQAEGPLLAMLHNNAHCAAGVVAVGNRQALTLKELKQYLLTGDARSPEEKLAVIEHEKGHADTRSFFSLVDLYIVHVVLRSLLKPSARTLLAPIFLVSATTLSSWFSEAVADMRAGRQGFHVVLTPSCAVTLEQNTAEGETDIDPLRRLSLALRPPETVDIAHSDECREGPSPCKGELGPGAHPPAIWRYNAYLYGDLVYPWLKPVLETIGSAVSLRPLIADPLAPKLDVAVRLAMEELEREQQAGARK